MNNIIENINEILKNFEIISGKIQWIQEHKNQILHLVLEQKISELTFYKLTSLLSAQSRSPLWEKYFRIKNDFEPVAKNENRGDFKKDGNYYEEYTMTIKKDSENWKRWLVLYKKIF